MFKTQAFKRGFSAPIAAALMLLMVLAATLLGGCSKEAPPAEAAKAPQKVEKKLNIVATTTMLQDLATAIGGEHVQVAALMGPGIDPHLYQASAGDVKKMQEADVVAHHGLHLEGKMDEVFASLAKQGRHVIRLDEGLDKAKLLADEDNPQLHDPHIWFDVALWKDAAQYMAQRLGSIDAANAAAYSANLKSYLLELDELDQYMKKRVQEVPEGQRVLVTAHDAFRYFGRAYGFTVTGLQGISTEAEAGTADVSKLAAFIADKRIKAIFVESSVPHKNIEALQAAVKAKGGNVGIGGELYSDALGDAASGHHTYLLTLKANIDTIVDALK